MHKKEIMNLFNTYAHLKEFVQKRARVRGVITSIPTFVTSPDDAEIDMDLGVNLIYPVGGGVFINIWGNKEKGLTYNIVQPELSDEERPKFEWVLDAVFMKASREKPHKTIDQFTKKIDKILGNVTKIVHEPVPFKKFKKKIFWKGRIPLTKREFDIIDYLIKRDVVHNGILEPLLHDPYIEDIHCVGTERLSLVHKKYGSIETNIKFRSMEELAKFAQALAEGIGRPVSTANPIADGALADGSRINIIYSEDVSVKGPTFTIRKFTPIPPSIIQLMRWGTLNSHVAAYLWIAIENGMSIFVCGETACGKTTTLNSVLPFIQEELKIFSSEGTLEVLPPHKTWQQLRTRESRGETKGVEAFDLLRAALRSRPDYIVVGEIRGVEGAVAFQAMQTGHSVLSTFHASSVRAMIQRFTSEPISVPLAFMDNLNICLIQMAVYVGGKFLRRVISIEELVEYKRELDGILTRKIFTWDPLADRFIFSGLNNSYILEEKIARIQGYENPRDIYDDVEERARVLDKLNELDIIGYNEVIENIWAYQRKGLAGLTFSI